MIDTEWFDIKGYEGFYQVNKNGDIKSVEKDIETRPGLFAHRKARLLKPTINNKGYMKVYLSKYGISENLYVHRIVAETFIENTNNLPQVNHINGNSGVGFCKRKYTTCNQKWTFWKMEE